VVKLNVITVPSSDFDGTYHTAFTVYNGAAGALRASAGWTLRDAIEFYAREYGAEKRTIGLIRPFVPQEMHLRGRVERI
jgi:hypothetical protein